MMGSKLQKILRESGEKTLSIFLDFMTRTAEYEELVDAGKRFLIAFHQEIEMFRRPQLRKTSCLVDDIITAHCTHRMKAYVEAGCKLSHQNIQNISKLHTCEQGLQDHVKKVKVLLDELQRLTEDAIVITRNTNPSVLPLLDEYLVEGTQQVLDLEEEKEVTHLQDESISHVTLMRAIYGMLKLDYAMQENIVQAINLSTPSSELESYSFMWDLQPFINDNVMHLAWKFVPRRAN